MSKKRVFNADKWLKNNMQMLVDTLAGEYVVVAEGEIYHGGTPSQLREKAKAEHPNTKLLGMRIPHPRDFIYALVAL